MKIKIILIVLLAGCLVGMLLQTCKYNKDKETLESQVTSLELENQKLDSISNKKDQTIYTQEAIITADQESIKRLVQEKFNLEKKHAKQVKEVIAYYSAKTVTKIQNVPVPFIDTVERKRFSDSVETACAEVIKHYEDNYVKVPQKVAAKDSSIEFNGTVTKQGLTIDSARMYDSTYLAFEVIKGGFMKKNFDGKRKLFLKKSVQIKVLHTNPNVIVLGQNSVLYKPKQGSKVVPFAVGFAAGLLIGSQ